MTTYSIFRKAYENKTLVIIAIFAISFLYSHIAVVISEIIIALSFLPRLFIDPYAERIIDKRLKEIFETNITLAIISSIILLLAPFIIVYLLTPMNQSTVSTNNILFPYDSILTLNSVMQWVFPLIISFAVWIPIIEFWFKNRK